jgi:hypothetical protein
VTWEQAKASVHPYRWMAPAVVALVIVIILVRGWNAERRDREELSRVLEAERLTRKGLVVELQGTQGELAARVTEVAGLREEVERVRSASPGVRVVEVVRVVTKPIPVDGPPRTVIAGCPSCALLTGDHLELRVGSAALETRAGNRVVVGVLEAWRVEDRARLAQATYSADVGQATVAQPARPPGWGAGVSVFGGKEGWSIGPAASPPPLRLWGLTGEAILGAGVGANGAWQANAAGLVRW